ncbi:MAG: TIGR03663 family protein [Chloroflexi bacterium]|nr:TIGR03663 family protein [Chloroflexota bacterium]
MSGGLPALLALIRSDRTLLVVLGIAAVALALRVIELDARAMHHDESLHAKYAWDFAEGRGYIHNPLMHGPLLFHTVAGVFFVAGDSEVASRLPMALAGAVLVFTPLLLRRWLGSAGVIVAAALIAASPVLLYYSRFSRNDVPAALWTLLLFAAIWRYRDDGRERWLVLAAAALAISFATKETAYLFAGLALLYINAGLTSALLDQLRGSGGAYRHALPAVSWLLLFPFAWLVAALWLPLAPLRRRIGWETLPREGDLMVVVGTMTVPFLGAALRIPFPGIETTTFEHAETAVVLALLAGSVLVGLLWRPATWLPIAALAWVITIPLFTTWFTNQDGFLSAFWGQLDYWLDQQDVQRGKQPLHYYVVMLPAYEFLALVPALIGGAWLLWRGDALMRLLVWWLLGIFVLLSLAGEKMPWLNVHLALPLALIAAHALGRALPAAWRALRASPDDPEDPEAPSGPPRAAWLWAGGSAVAALLVAASLWTAFGVSYRHPDTPVEPLIYTQTSPDVPVLAREIEEFVRAQPTPTPVVVDTTASLTWPWAWYLRDVPNVGYLGPDAIREYGPGDGAVLISASSTVGPGWALRHRFEQPRPYVHRWWFREEGYRAATPRGVLEQLASGDLLEDWLSFLATRTEEETIGALRGHVWFPLR